MSTLMKHLFDVKIGCFVNEIGFFVNEMGFVNENKISFTTHLQPN